MTLRPTPRARAATPTDPYRARHVPAVRPATVLLMTTLAAMDGTVLLLAARGTLNTWSGAVATGLTVVAGAGAWITARQAFAPRTGRPGALAVVALLSVLAVVAAAWLGGILGDRVELHVLPHAVGLVLLAVAGEVGGLPLPRIGHLPVSVLGTVVAGLLEVLSQWIR